MIRSADEAANVPHAVLDTSVLLSSHRHWLWYLARTGYFEAVWSTFIVGEMVRIRVQQAIKHGVERAVYRQRVNDLIHLLSDVLRVADYRSVTPSTALRDADDLPILATALAGGAGFIVTLNTSDFPSDTEILGVRMLTPAAFLTELVARFPDGQLPNQVSTMGRQLP